MINRQQYSIILIAFNEASTIESTIKSIFEINYNHDDFELIFIDDASTDRTLEIAKALIPLSKEKQISYSIIENVQNEGRIKSRIIGIKHAKHERIVLFDARLTPSQDILRKANKYPTSTTLITNAYMNKNRSLEDRVLYLIRKKLYKPYWGYDFQQVEIKKENYGKISKGTGGLITTKSLFINQCKGIKGEKDENDDTKILKKYIDNRKKVIRVPEPRSLYKNRTGLSAIKHIFQRGPKFVDYYFKSLSKYLLVFISLHLIVGLAIGISLLFNPIIMLFTLGISLAFMFAISIYLAEDLIDVVSVLLYLPVIVTIFYLGILTGLVAKLTKDLKKYLPPILTASFLSVFLVYFLSNIKDFEILIDINPMYLILIALLQLSVIIINGVFFIVILQNFKIKIAFRESLLISTLSAIGNYFTPFRGGAGMRAIYLKKNHKLSYSDFLSTLAGNYVIVFFVNSMVALIGLLILKLKGVTASPVLFLFFGALATTLLGLIVLPIKDGGILTTNNYIPKLISRNTSLVIRGWNRLTQNRKVIFQLILLTLINSLIGIVLFYVEFNALEVETDFVTTIIFSSISSVSLLLSITPGSIGIREGILILFQGTLALEKNEILASAIIDRGTYFFVMLIAATIVKASNIKLIRNSNGK